jgi:hypothetical protein
MTTESTQFMAEALKRVKLNGSFEPADIGRWLGFSKTQSEVTARALSNAGILVLGFDSAAHFSTEFQKMQARTASKRPRKK